MVAGYCPIFEHLYQRSLPTEELLDSQMKVFSCWNKADLQAGKYTARLAVYLPACRKRDYLVVSFSSDLVRGVHLCMSFKRQSCEMQETRAVARGGGGGALGYFLDGYVPPGTPNWHPVLKKNPPKIDTPF